MNDLSIWLQHWQGVINLPFSTIVFFGCLYILYSEHYSLSGNKIPLWHRAPMLAVGLGAFWVSVTSFAGLASGGDSAMSYWRIGVIGELLVNAGLAFIVLAFSVNAFRKIKSKSKNDRHNR